MCEVNNKNALPSDQVKSLMVSQFFWQDCKPLLFWQKRKSLVAMEKYWLLWQLLYDQLVCMVAVYNLASMPIQNMSKIGHLFMVAKEINGCYGEVLVAMDTACC